MALRQRTGSTLCPGCGTLVGVNDEVCYNCGRRNPALWGFSPLLRNLGRDLGFTNIVTVACVALYLATLVVTAGHSNGAFGLSPDPLSLFLFGASGALPVFQYGRWWTVLSAGWLHAGVIHIVLNMYSFRQLGPPTADFYGPARTVIIFVLGSAAGFLLSSLAGHFLWWMPFRFLRGADLTVGASAGIFALIGALAYYGRRTGSSAVRTFITSNAVIWILWGVLMPGIDNYAHAGGFLGGYAASRILDPLTRERVDHMILALGCLAISAIAIVASFVVGIPTR